MSSGRESKCEATENPDEAVLDILDRESVGQLSDWPQNDNNDRHGGKCMLCTEDEKLIINSKSSENKLLLKESCSSFHDRDCGEKIEEFHYYVEMVKEIVRPGCSPETLNVALSSMSSIVENLCMISSKQYINASL